MVQLDEGAAASWPPLRGTVCVGRGQSRLPAPTVTRQVRRRTVDGRRWLMPWGPRLVEATDSAVVCEAVAAAIAHGRLGRHAQCEELHE
ncbi:hypothetical protein GCM10022245_54790 [Streptomyces mayteni]